MKSYWVYMLLCSDGHFYVGITSNIEQRVAAHNLGADRRAYTFTRRPVKLVHTSTFYDVEEGIKWEKQLKGWSRAKKQALIAEDWPEIQMLSRTHRHPSTGSA